MTEQPERDQLGFKINPPEDNTQPQWGEPVGTAEEMAETARDYGFPSRAAFLRCMVRLGMNTLVEQDPTKTDHQSNTQDNNPVSIRELIPKGEENSVDITGEFWEEILRGEMLDIVEEDPEIKRDGYSVYR